MDTTGFELLDILAIPYKTYTTTGLMKNLNLFGYRYEMAAVTGQAPPFPKIFTTSIGNLHPEHTTVRRWGKIKAVFCPLISPVYDHQSLT